MFRFIVRRLLQLIPTLFGLSLLLFIWLRRLPGGPETAILGERGTPEMRAAIRRNIGLDEPILVQYGRFVRRLIKLDLGTSTSTKRAVTTEFIERFPGTVELTITAMIIAIGIGIPLGYLAARRRGRLLDHASVGGSLIGICIPVFFLGVRAQGDLLGEPALVPVQRPAGPDARGDPGHQLLRPRRPA